MDEKNVNLPEEEKAELPEVPTLGTSVDVPENKAGEVPTMEVSMPEPVKKGMFGRKKAKKEKVKKSAARETLEWIAVIVTAVVAALIIRSFIGEFVRVDGSSMWGTLVDGEFMVVSKLDYASDWVPTWDTFVRDTGYWFEGIGNFFTGKKGTNKALYATNTDEDYHKFTRGEPQRFDVVICRYPNRGSTNFVKRIVGLPGDEIEMKVEGDYVYLYVNGVKYEEEYLINRANYYTRTPIIVPEDQYFVLGDNRSNSNDSHLIGPIDRSMVMGKVVYIIFPFNRTRPIPNGLEDNIVRDLEYLVPRQ